jgi:hypothetical protein
MLDLQINVHNSKFFFNNNTLKVINNSQKEILDAVIEMEEIDINSDYYKNVYIKKMHNYFWKIIDKKNNKLSYFLRERLKIKISSKFLISNENLLR